MCSLISQELQINDNIQTEIQVLKAAMLRATMEYAPGVIVKRQINIIYVIFFIVN